jgi:hypothetical protein
VIVTNAWFKVRRDANEAEPREDELGDPVDDPDAISVVAERLPGQLEKRQGYGRTPAGGGNEVVADYLISFTGGQFEFRNTDRLEDEVTGRKYLVRDVDMDPGLMGGLVELRCKRIE